MESYKIIFYCHQPRIYCCLVDVWPRIGRVIFTTHKMLKIKYMYLLCAEEKWRCSQESPFGNVQIVHSFYTLYKINVV